MIFGEYKFWRLGLSLVSSPLCPDTELTILEYFVLSSSLVKVKQHLCWSASHSHHEESTAGKISDMIREDLTAGTALTKESVFNIYPLFPKRLLASI